ncbi:MAG: hypothetical protein WAM70_00320, partial [Pyrinomonadaceae bacterium]
YFNGSAWLSDNSSRATSSIILHSGDADSSISFFTSAANNNGVGAERMRIDKNGNVGIGTVTPGAKFEVDGSGLMRVTEGSRIVPTTGVGLELSADSGGSYVGAYNRSTSAYRRLYFYGSPYVFEAGNMGIGTASPGSLLQIANAAQPTHKRKVAAALALLVISAAAVVAYVTDRRRRVVPNPVKKAVVSQPAAADQANRGRAKTRQRNLSLQPKRSHWRDVSERVSVTATGRNRRLSAP